MFKGIVFDAVEHPVIATKLLELTKQLRDINSQIDVPAKDVEGMLKDIALIAKGNSLINQIRDLSAEVEGVALQIDDNPAIPLQNPRKATEQFYQFHDFSDVNARTTKTQRQKFNNEAYAVVKQYLDGELKLEDVTDEQRAILARYTGNGGKLIDNKTGQYGSAFEYYTPEPVAKEIWTALEEMGFSGGKVLDPCAGVGIFGATAPLNTAVDCVELDETSGTINKLINESDSFKVQVSNFEKVASSTPDEIYDAVVTNVPFGDNREGNQLDDPKYQKEPLENYFILRSLDKLKPNGLACFVVPPRCVSGKGGSVAKLRLLASYKAEFLGAYRLPNDVFKMAGADTITDVIFFRKFSKDAQNKIKELKESSPTTLIESNVLWTPFLKGKYFDLGENKKRILGEFIPKDPNKFRDVDRVKNPASIADVAKLLRKLPKSRIKWDLLETAETQAIIYNEGDTIFQDGQTLQLQGGEWIALEHSRQDMDNIALLNMFETALNAFTQKATYQNMRDLLSYMQGTAQYQKIPAWLTALENSFERFNVADRENYFMPCVVGCAVSEVLESEGLQSGVNFLETYPSLSKAMKDYVSFTKKIKVKGLVKKGLDAISFHYSRKDGYSNLWKGEVSSIDELHHIEGDSSFEGLIYRNKSPYVSLEDARQIYGNDFNPMTNDDWCISGDGHSVIRADDYYSGSYATFANKIDADIQNAPTNEIKEKLLRQKLLASDRIAKIDVKRMNFNLRSPYVTLEEKVEFLRAYVHSGAYVELDADGNGKIKFNIDQDQAKNHELLKLYRRLALYIENGSATLGSADFDNRAVAIKKLRELIAKTNEQFKGWARSNEGITNRLDAIGNDPSKMFFTQTDDNSDLNIVGMNPDLSLHDYQNAFVRKMSRGFEGINAFDVGLGKTFTALASVQYVQSIGVKKKTIFVVPNSVLSNWKKEVAHAYTSIDDCLFVGLREVNGKMVANSNNYDEDLHRILENNHSKIFMTMEAFERIKLRDETINDFESYLRNIDVSFAQSDDRKRDAKGKNKVKTLVQVLVGKTGSAPYLEDMNVDSIVIDEAHAYKNSAETMDFKGGKYLSIAGASGRGLDAQAKAWFIRGKSDKGDGVMLLTASPITNSPLEVYSMLSLAVGHGRVNDLAIGTNGADGFMSAVCQMVNEADEGIDGTIRDMQVFRGLENADMLKRAVTSIATIKDAKMVGKSIYVPEALPVATEVDLTPEIIDSLQQYKNAYRFARNVKLKRPVTDEEESAYNAIKDKFKEEDEVIGHPFNLIRKMTNLILDPDLDNQVTSYIFAENEREDVKKLVTAWNADKKNTEERLKLGPYTLETSILSEKVRASDNAIVYKVAVRAWIDGKKVYIDSTAWKTQDKFEALLEKSKVDYDVTIPPKLSAMLENFKNESAVPRGIVKNEDGKEITLPYAKQIIFCDSLSSHNKIKRLLSKHAGVSASKIVVVTGQRNNDPADMLDIQLGFNAVEDNKYQVIIANEKAEVGINLQIGTQANHHLTIGWTPDAIQQRNGRSARQGNLTDSVKSYFYDASGTFDVAKRTLVNNKSEWINDLLYNDDGSNQVEIAGGLSDAQMELLIDSIGDVDGVAKIQKQAEEAERLARIERTRTKQATNLSTILKENTFLKNNQAPTDFVAKALGDILPDYLQIKSLEQANARKTTSLNTIAKNEKAIENLNENIKKKIAYIDNAVTIHKREFGSEGKALDETYTIQQVLENFINESAVKDATTYNLIKAIKDKNVKRMPIELVMKPDSELENDWQESVDMSKRIIEKAVEAYEEDAQRTGAFDQGIADAFKDGKASLVANQPVTDNSFIVLNKDPNKGIFPVGRDGYSGYQDGLIDGSKKREVLYTLLNNIDGWEVVNPNTPLFEQCVQFGADFDDNELRAGRLFNSNFFSDRNDFVRRARKTTVLKKYRADYDRLPSPYFPIVIKPKTLLQGDTNVMAKIQAEQAKVIEKYELDDYWIKADFEGIYYEYLNPSDTYDLFAEYAIAHNLKLSLNEIGGSVYFINKKLNQSAKYNEDTLFKRISEADSREGIYQAVRSYIAECLTWLDVENATELPINSSLLSLRVTRFIDDKKANLERIANSETVAEVPKPIQYKSGVDESRILKDLYVKVTGDGTKRNKDRFKDLGADFLKENPTFNKRFNYGAKWNGYEKHWEFPYGAWLKFKKNYPSELSSLKMEILN